LTREANLLSDEEAAHLFEKLFLHYRKKAISEEEMLDFFRQCGLRIGDRKELLLLMFKAEKGAKWMVAGIGAGWKPMMFARSPQDLEEFLEKHGISSA